MAYSAEVVSRARARLAQAKEDRESENRQHLAVAYARVPRIREIDMLLRRTMAQAAYAAFQQGSDGRELLEQARQQNLELQQERAILAMENFEEGYLDDSPICDKCGAVIGVIVLCKVKKLKVATVLDVTLLGFFIGQILGRWGNFFNREAFGAATDSFFRMGLYNTVTSQWEYYHPTFLYESVWNLVGFILLHFLSKRRQYDGQIALGYAAWYGLGRCFIEGLRVDSLYWGPFRVSQVLAGLTCVAASAILLWQAFKPHDRANLFVNRVVPADEPKEEPREN